MDPPNVETENVEGGQIEIPNVEFNQTDYNRKLKHLFLDKFTLTKKLK